MELHWRQGELWALILLSVGSFEAWLHYVRLYKGIFSYIYSSFPVYFISPLSILGCFFSVFGTANSSLIHWVSWPDFSQKLDFWNLKIFVFSTVNQFSLKLVSYYIRVLHKWKSESEILENWKVLLIISNIFVSSNRPWTP